MDLKEAKKKIEKIDNEIEYYLKEKERLFETTQPKAVDTTKQTEKSRNRVDRFLQYEISLEEKQLNEKINKKYEEKMNLENFIDKELHRLGKYREVEQLIVYYKEICIEKHTWNEIAQRVFYSKEQCQRIYKRWKGKRNIWKDDTP